MTAHSVNELCWDLVGYEMVAVKKNIQFHALCYCTNEHFTQQWTAVQAASCFNPAFGLISAPHWVRPPFISCLSTESNQISGESNWYKHILYRLYPTRTEIMGNKSEEPIQIPGKTNWHNHLLTSLKCDTNITSIHLFVWPGQLLEV